MARQDTVAITFHPNCSLPLVQERAERAKEKRS
jgi:hypothetical protein